MDTTIYEDERTHQVTQLAELTRKGKINWECVDYAPFGFMLGRDIDEIDPYLSQMITLETQMNGDTFELQLSESIDLLSGKGNIVITLERDGMNGFSKYEYALSYEHETYDDCPAEKLGKVFENHIATLFASAIPKALESDTVTSTFEWARFVVEEGVGDDVMAHPLFKLGERLFNKHDLLAFHRCVLDYAYRQSLLHELG